MRALIMPDTSGDVSSSPECKGNQASSAKLAHMYTLFDEEMGRMTDGRASSLLLSGVQLLQQNV